MEPVRVKIMLNPKRGTVDDEWNCWNKLFHEKTGTVVYTSWTPYGGYNVSIELDEPVEPFGKFAKMVYVFEEVGRDLLAVPEDKDAFWRLVKLQEDPYGGDHFSKWHDKRGDPLPWSVVSEKIDAFIEWRSRQ